MRLLTSVCTAIMLLAQSAGAVGFQWRTAPDPEGMPIPVAIWYPSDAATQLDPGAFSQRIAPEGAVNGIHLPLIVLSHGTGGSPLNYYDTAIALAEAGFVVAGPLQSGDNYADRSRSFTQRNFADRPRQISRLLDYMLEGWGSHDALDPTRIGIIGHSAGGATAFLVAGGRIDPARVLAFCAATPQDWGCRNGMQRGAAALWDATAPPFSGRDPRVTAAVLAAPALGAAYLPGDVDIPVQIWLSGRDQLVTDGWSATHAVPAADVHLQADAGHFSYLTQCGEMLNAAAHEICVDPQGFDRAIFLSRFQQAVVAFFREHLGQ